MRGWLVSACAALALVAGVAPAAADDALWTLLRSGGQVILLRHAATDRSVADPPGFRLDDCSTQRNLIDEGREQARRLGEVLRARAVPIGRVPVQPVVPLPGDRAARLRTRRAVAAAERRAPRR